MTVYAMFVTFILGGLTVIVIYYSIKSWEDGKALKALEKREEEAHAARLLDKAYREDDEHQQAVDLCSEELGATILNIEKHV